MTREPAQAGNRAGRTEHHLQWWDDSPEQLAVTPVADKQRNSGLFLAMPVVDANCISNSFRDMVVQFIFFVHT